MRLLLAAPMFALAALLAATPVAAQRLVPEADRVAARSFVLPLLSSPVAPAPDSLRLADLRGQVVVIDLWAPWCVPCGPMHDQLAEYAHDAPDGVRVVSIAVAARPASVLDFLARRASPPFSVALANGRARTALGVTSVPDLLIVDREGRVAWSGAGGRDPRPLLARLVPQVLGGAPTGATR